MKYIFPFLLIIAILSCKKPVDPISSTDRTPVENAGPIIFYTSLNDSLSAKAMETLQLGNVTGIKVKYLSGNESRYFAYDAEKSLVIRTISQLAFIPFTKYSDTHCRKIHYDELNSTRQTISWTEYESSSFFWNADPEKLEVYECIKSPYKHTLLIDPKSNHILHRIELIG